MSLTPRKSAELSHRVESLARELTLWRGETEDGTLEKHWSQVAAVAGEIEVPLATLRAQIAALEGDEALEDAARIEGVVADLHRLWDIFRARLALRSVEHFAPYLLAADELAYRCYQPAEALGAGREPPLVAFANCLSPVTRTRGQELRPADELASGDPLREALRRLPVPLIDLPWSQVEHLPDAPIIAHEVGHDVEADLELGADMADALDAALLAKCATDDQRAAWAAWRQEAFADVFGTLCLGPAFTSALIDFLAVAPTEIEADSQGNGDWRPHPPSALRVLLSAAVLELMDFPTEAAAHRALWTEAYPRDAIAPFAGCVNTVAAVLREAAAGLGAFSLKAHARASEDADKLLRGRSVTTEDARELVAAARLAFDRSPQEFDEQRVAPYVLDLIAERQTVGRRAGRKDAPDPKALAARAAEAGRWLERHLAGVHGLDPEEPTRETHVQAQH